MVVFKHKSCANPGGGKYLSSNSRSSPRTPANLIILGTTIAIACSFSSTCCVLQHFLPRFNASSNQKSTKLGNELQGSASRCTFINANHVILSYPRLWAPPIYKNSHFCAILILIVVVKLKSMLRSSHLILPQCSSECLALCLSPPSWLISFSNSLS